jgi:hypothetical protein
MVPPSTHSMWAKLITGDVSYKFRQASASMLFFNLQREYKKSPANLNQLIQQARAFFEKYERTLQSDIQSIFN